MARYSGSGWHNQSIRHSNARKYGKAGGRYANKRVLHYGISEYQYMKNRIADINVNEQDYKEMVLEELQSADITRKQFNELLKEAEETPVAEPMKNYGKASFEIPYASEVEFYSNPKDHKTITIQQKYVGKGWYELTFGEDNGFRTIKTRNPSLERAENLRDFYPTYEPVSFFWDTSFHSSKNGFGNYGTHDYNMDFTQRTKSGKEFLLEQPVKTEKKNQFGKIIKKIPEQTIDYVALDWRPEGDTEKLFITHSQHTPFGKKEVFKSKEHDVKDKKEAIKHFKEYVEKIKVKQWVSILAVEQRICSEKITRKPRNSTRNTKKNIVLFVDKKREYEIKRKYLG